MLAEPEAAQHVTELGWGRSKRYLPNTCLGLGKSEPKSTEHNVKARKLKSIILNTV